MGGGDVAGTQGTVAEQGLKHLEFLHVAALHAAACVLNLYGYAKEKSGPLKPRVESVEGAVKTAVRPVFDKYHDGPIELLKFVDLKVDQSMVEINRRIPPVVKQVSSEALSAAHKVPGAARAAAAEVKGAGVVGTASEIAKSMYSKYEPKAEQYAAGVVGTASGMAKSVYIKYEPTVRELYSKYEPKAEQYAAAAWCRLNELPVFPQAANMVVPAASFCSDKYNEAVLYTAEKGYRVSTFLPLIPIERIAKLFRREMLEMEPLVARS